MTKSACFAPKERTADLVRSNACHEFMGELGMVVVVLLKRDSSVSKTYEAQNVPVCSHGGHDGVSLWSWSEKLEERLLG